MGKGKGKDFNAVKGKDKGGEGKGKDFSAG
jgi:hypothetical protein